MTFGERISLAPLTSLGVGGAARYLGEAHTPAEIREAAAFARARGLALRVLGAGTNLLVPDEGVEAVVLTLPAGAMSFAPEQGGVVRVSADAGVSWDALVAAACECGLWGIENLAGIPGTVGGALVQNIGAYGAELATPFLHVQVLNLATGQEHRLERGEAALGYRTSLFKGRRDLIVLSMTLNLSPEGTPNLAYADLARARGAGVPLATPREVARAVRAIRREKFPEAGCAGSFFKNPIVGGETLTTLVSRYPDLPTYRAEGGTKVSLAWLLDHALGLKGYAKGPARLFERQPLVIVASEGACAGEVEALAREVEERVHEACGITLEREVETFA